MASRCSRCGLELPHTYKGCNHPNERFCILSLQEALRRLRELAQVLAFAASTRSLEVLRKLAQEESANADKAFDVFERIYHRFQEMGDWSPMEVLREEVRELKAELEARPPAVSLRGEVST